jgi:two-component system NtrC family sensor kinase
LRQNDVSCQFEHSDDTIELRIDKIQLTQVVFNLIVNAIYFAPPKSTISVSLATEKDNVILKIADQGPGIPEESISHIFDPFFTTKPVGEGSGLGLSVVHGIVQSHRGSIEVTPNTPAGTIFTLQFPKK